MSTTGQKPAPDPFFLRSLADDPFCQRSSPEIARDVHDAAMWTLAAFEELRAALTCDLPAPGDVQDVVGYHGDLRRAVEQLGRRLECVSGWWFTSPPPAFAPDCLSAAEALLVASARLVACLDAPLPEQFRAVSDAVGAQDGILPPTFTVPHAEEFGLLCLFAAEKAATFDYDIVGAAIKTEAMAMALRPPPDGTMVCGRGMWDFTGSRSRLTLESVLQLASARARSQARYEEATGFPVWLERRCASQEVPSSTTAALRQSGRPPLRDQNRGPELITRIIALDATGKSWREIAEAMNAEFPELAGAGFTAGRVRGIWRREKPTEQSVNPDREL